MAEVTEERSRQLFNAACEKAATYPLSLIRTQKLPRALQNYNESLFDARGCRLFNSTRQKFILWDLTEEASGTRTSS